jgi:Flp pilus assembly protein TadG
MAFMLTVLIGSAAFAVDFGRMYLYRTQLHSASDAAALAGAFQVLKKVATTAPDSAVAIANRHAVGTGNVSLAVADVIPGHWALGSGFAARADFSVGDVNAVQVTTRYTGNYGFGKILGLTSHDVTATSQAVMEYVGATNCIRPVSIPYQSLLNQIYGVDGSGNPIMPVTHDLTNADVDSLRAAGPAAAVQLKLGDESTQGNFYLLQLGPYAHADQVAITPGPNWGGQNVFADRFGGGCSNSPWSIGPGDWLQGKTGNAGGPTSAGFDELCGGNSNGNGFHTCGASLAARSIKVAMWATENDGICTPRCFQVKYVGVFVVTGYSKTPGNAADGIWGYFTTLATTGSFSVNPSPVQKIGLVK